MSTIDWEDDENFVQPSTSSRVVGKNLFFDLSDNSDEDPYYVPEFATFNKDSSELKTKNHKRNKIYKEMRGA